MCTGVSSKWLRVVAVVVLLNLNRVSWPIAYTAARHGEVSAVDGGGQVQAVWLEMRILWTSLHCMQTGNDRMISIDQVDKVTHSLPKLAAAESLTMPDGIVRKWMMLSS